METSTMIQNDTPDQARYQRAKERVDTLRGFYGHALVFVLVNLGLAAYNIAVTPDRLWFVFTLAGWGIGLLAHGAYAMSSGRFFGAEWEARKIREELDRDQHLSR